jgi:hypothetical protein
MYFGELESICSPVAGEKNCERIVAEVVCVCVCVAEHSAMHILDDIA